MTSTSVNSASRLVSHWPFAVFGGTFTAFCVTQILFSKSKAEPESTDSANPSKLFISEEERRNVFSGKAKQWDGLVRWTELASGIGWWRRKLIRHAYGDVLEVAVGSGRNFKFYDSNKVSSITAVDYSRPMLETSLVKKFVLGKIPLRLICSKVSDLAVHFPQADKFDCVVDSFGLCSFDDPVASLKEMARLCKPDTGRILLLEHGDSTWSYFKNYLASNLPKQVEKFGCYHNRPIREIVSEAGLEVVYEKRKHFGTIYLIVCRKIST